MSGRVVHFEIPFDDGERARAFYQDAFGWNIMAMGEDYHLVMSGPTEQETGPTEPGFINGGMLERGSNPVTSPVLVVDVPSIDEALEKIEKLGGATVTGKTPVGDFGFSAYFKDPEGNLMGLWESVGQ
ncbi:putative enzyme related to lactoylglutathione lyase [Kibdelosporangium banguiense]|uniref:Enzyme related to lactoylglutathione lyase n=1 Tax=Kibdelosporangium banguiense TaxID=1365924 RepID=A0ABS4T9N6_9PSEU|nr:VOC family protein [Kibdelosporangium banguiense]MBP2320810.1 putative enzyme related to lactoylglutathione lyase [Kibdelosporangium banguiense]